MKGNREILCGASALLVSALFFVCCLRISVLAEAISSYGNINIIVYGMTLILFCLVFFAGMLLMGRRSIAGPEILERAGVKRGVMLLMLAGQALFFAVGMSRETSQVGSVAGKYGWHTQPLLLMICLFLLEAAAFFWIYDHCKAETKGGAWILPLLYASLTVLIFYSMDTPNIFGRGEWGDSYHAHAYFNSIYNVYWGMPYTSELTSIYGHYGLLWKLPMELIGGDFRKFVFLMAILGAVTHLCAFLVLHMIVKSRVLRVLGAFGVSFPILGMRGGYYWQLWPHRMIFPMILLLYAAWVFKKGKYGWKTVLPGYIICLLGVVWNTETGMILAAAWACAHISRMFSTETMKLKTLLQGAAFHVLGVAGSFLGAYGLVNLYNVLKHSPANTIKEFLIPLMTDAYMTDVLHLELPMYPSAYMGEIILFLIGISMGIAGWRWFVREKRCIPWQTGFLFFLSVSALGRLVYYMNRPAYHNLDCCHLSAVILLAYLGEKGIWFIKEKRWGHPEKCSFEGMVKGTAGLLCMTALLALATGTVLQFSQNSQIKENFHNTDEFYGYTEAIAAQVPANTMAFGLNVTEIYSALHWNTQCFTIDFSDMFVAQESAVKLERQLKEEGAKQVFTSQESLPIWEKFNPEGFRWFCENYTLDKTFPVNGIEFQYYVKK